MLIYNTVMFLNSQPSPPAIGTKKHYANNKANTPAPKYMHGPAYPPSPSPNSAPKNPSRRISNTFTTWYCCLIKLIRLLPRFSCKMSQVKGDISSKRFYLLWMISKILSCNLFTYEALNGKSFLGSLFFLWVSDYRSARCPSHTTFEAMNET